MSLNGYYYEWNFKESIALSTFFVDVVTIQFREESITNNISMYSFCDVQQRKSMTNIIIIIIVEYKNLKRYLCHVSYPWPRSPPSH